MNMVTYNVAFYEASAQTMTVYYEGQSLEDYVLEKRAVRLKSFASHYAPDVLALQEVNWRWWSHIVTGEDSIVNRLGYDWAGNLSTFGNGDGVNVGKDHDIYNLLLWKKDVYEASDRGVFRLNDRLYSNADQDRMCTYAILKNRETGTEILYASAHLCTHINESMNALSLSQARTLTDTLERLAEGRTIVVGGDFNSYDTADCYRHMTETAGFLDSRKHAAINHTPSMCSARVWGREPNWNNGKSTPIDHIFYKGDRVTAEEWTVLTDTYDGEGRVSTDMEKIGVNYDLSDHQGVSATFREVR
jgi:endonuclease/exonuclease/phosphatase family metal-dependent hydrolase